MFSGALRLTDLDDFIAPSQACIKPVKVDRSAAADASAADADDMQVDASGGVSVMARDGSGKRTALAKATITLHDCLACSGCVTSAETILVQQQSTGEFTRRLAAVLAPRASSPTPLQQPICVMTVSPQSRASLAAHFGLPVGEIASRLTSAMHSIGVALVLDSTLGRDVSLLLHGEDFVQRYRARRRAADASSGAGAGAGASAAGPSSAATAAAAAAPARPDAAALPLMTGVCPGWVCYAEKRHGEYVLPYISGVRSPQQIMGVLVKRYLAAQRGLRAADIYHVCVMPCFDKKLEASRPEFEEDGCRDVDTVLSSGELLDLLRERGIDLRAVQPAAQLDVLPIARGADGEAEPSAAGAASASLYSHEGGGSGGYAVQVARYAMRTLFGADMPAPELRKGRNADVTEFTLDTPDGALTFAMVYGFRNIQNILRRVKMGKCAYAFVEVMACPSGCLNGGGQIRPDSANDSVAQHFQRVVQAYDSVPNVEPGASGVVRGTREWLAGASAGAGAGERELLHTTYHHVLPSKDLLSTALKW